MMSYHLSVLFLKFHGNFIIYRGKRVTIKKLLALSISNSIVETLFGKKKLYKESKTFKV